MARTLRKSPYIFLVLLVVIVASCGSDELEIIPPTPPDPMEDDQDDQDGNRTYSTEQYTVGDVNLEIYLPSDYQAGNRYPTIYFNDGEFFAEVFGSLTGLEAEPFIMVGLWDGNNRAARFSAYTDASLTTTYGEYTPSATAYTEALIQEVVPFVEGMYPSSKRALFGISLGGLHATWAGINYPDEFSFIGALSPSYWVGDGAIFSESLEALRPEGIARPKAFYIDRGTAEWRNFMPLVEGLLQVELVYGESVFYYEVIGAGHDVPFWLLRIEVPFRLFMESDAALTDMELNAYCADNLDEPGSSQARINPIVTYSNGVRYSVMSTADFEVVSGDGSVQEDGSYTISSGSSMTVACTYMGFSKQVLVESCN